MWKNVNEMTKEDLQSELEDLQELLLLSEEVTVDSLLTKKHNLDALKRLGLTITPNGEFFRIDDQGFLSILMEKMYNDRVVYKEKQIDADKRKQTAKTEEEKRELENLSSRYKNLQLAKKVSLNSAYGALGNQFFRFYDIHQATAITTAGQLSIRWIEDKINIYLNRILGTKDIDYVIASDTDSIYLSLDKLVSRTIMETIPNAPTEKVIDFMDAICKDKIQPVIDKSYNELSRYINAYAQKMIMKRESLANRGIWTAKKRYILNVYDNEGVRYAKPDIKVMGLEMVKSSTPSACRKKMEEAIELIINSSNETLIEFLDKFREEFKTLHESEIAFPRSVNGIDEYYDASTQSYKKATPIHVRGAIVYNTALRKAKLTNKYPPINNGEKIKFIYLVEPNLFRSNIIAFHNDMPKELDIRKYIDYNTQYEKSFLEPIKIILDVIGWNVEEINSLENLFV